MRDTLRSIVKLIPAKNLLLPECAMKGRGCQGAGLKLHFPGHLKLFGRADCQVVRSAVSASF